MVPTPRRPIATILLLAAVLCGSQFAVHCRVACSLEAARHGGTSAATRLPPNQARAQYSADCAGCGAAPLVAALNSPSPAAAIVPNTTLAIAAGDTASMTVRPVTRRMEPGWQDPSPPPRAAVLPLRI